MIRKTGKEVPAIIALVIVVVIAGVWLLRNRSATEGDPGAGASSTAAVTSEQVDTIVGRWRREDGGYIVDIRGLDAAGNLEVAYYNPRPINVSRTAIAHSATGLHIFIELRDTGYPGATYRLDYDGARDVMTGVYYQPSVDQSFDVVFVRTQ